MTYSWRVNSTWLVHEEGLTPDAWLVILRRPDGYVRDIGFPWGWVYVFDREQANARNIIETFRLEEPDPLTQECIAIEMREKYKSP